MSTYIVTYDLNKEVTRPNITKHLHDGFSAWARLSESSYAITTDLSPDQVYNYFLPLLDSNDSLLVITLKLPYWGQHKAEVIKWLDAELTY